MNSVVVPVKLKTLSSQLAAITGARELFPDLWLLPGVTDASDLAASSLLFLQSQPLLVDAGMRADVALALRELGIVKRLHLTHMHLDHRSRQSYFVGESVTCPELERPAFVDWDSFLSYSGFKTVAGFDFHAWRARRFNVDLVPEVVGLKDGQAIASEQPAYLLALPGHTQGHSGLWLPHLKAALVTDYDMEPFGPWYGNPISDLDAYERTLRQLLERPDIDWFITSHQRGMLDRESFHGEAERYLRLIAERSEKIYNLLTTHQPKSLRELVGQGVFYSRSAYAKNPVFAVFENRMTLLHLQRLEQAGQVCQTADGWLAF